ncbi:hypothetical protein P6B95_09850 [Streptomyces atratus]|uniref:hypothetical protein n=1 Tax=Streptomyces atratus TaxID=1893 RepID=UPI002AC329B8|nr:hypothetical protein [Streptomyces atratus]WPW27649.1 hypothetical protein P6B95_09850 [Streptomyces atratus]
MALPSRRPTAALTAHRAELVHLAGPFVLGVRGMAAATRLGLPTVAVYRTDLAGYARTYPGTGENTAWRRMRAVHSAADRTPARPPPPSATSPNTACPGYGCGHAASTPDGFGPGCGTRHCAAVSPRAGSGSSGTSDGSPRTPRRGLRDPRGPGRGCRGRPQ